MKALTLQQPWATLIAIGAKSVETRRWHPSYHPGHLVICSSKKPITGPAHERLLASEPYASHLDGLDALKVSRGCMLAVVRLYVCQRTEAVVGKLSETEQAFGDYRTGRWAWFLSDLMPLPEPVPLAPIPKGQKDFRLGLWDLRAADEENLARALGQDAYQRLKRSDR